MCTVLFVCTGNTCRSPMAQHMLAGALRESGGDADIRVESAGLAAADGAQMSAGAQRALARRGVTAAGRHRSRRLTAGMVADAGLILTMTMAHKNALLRLFPDAVEKVFTLREYAAFDEDGQKLLTEWQALTVETELARASRGAADGAEECRTPEARRLRLEHLAEQLPDLDIDDPFGGGDDAYERAAAAIEAACGRVADRLRRLGK